jgi:hypothetical protein
MSDHRWVSFSDRTLHMATPTSAAAFNGSTNRLIGSGITHDNAGNLTAHPFLTPGAGGGMVYNASNKMTQFTATGVQFTAKGAYRYDAQGAPRVAGLGRQGHSGEPVFRAPSLDTTLIGVHSGFLAGTLSNQN